MRTFNRIETKRRRQSLRSSMTRGEKLLWSRLRGKRLCGLKFRRQAGIENYIVDFYCPELHLVVEVDGDVHGYNSQEQKDKQKQDRLEELGIKVVRFTNGDVLESIDGVLRKILSNHPLPPSLSKEGE